METIMETKVCSKCKVEKQRSDFAKNNSVKDGLQSSCKSCSKQYNILNYNKDILNSSIKLTKDYDINNFNNIVADYDYNNILE